MKFGNTQPLFSEYDLWKLRQKLPLAISRKVNSQQKQGLVYGQLVHRN